MGALEQLAARLEQQNALLAALQDKIDLLIKKSGIEEDITLSAQEAAEYLGYSYNHFMSHYADEIDQVRRGRELKFKLSAIRAWEKKNIRAGKSTRDETQQTRGTDNRRRTP